MAGNLVSGFHILVYHSEVSCSHKNGQIEFIKAQAKFWSNVGEQKWEFKYFFNGHVYCPSPNKMPGGQKCAKQPNKNRVAFWAGVPNILAGFWFWGEVEFLLDRQEESPKAKLRATAELEWIEIFRGIFPLKQNRKFSTIKQFGGVKRDNTQKKATIFKMFLNFESISWNKFKFRSNLIKMTNKFWLKFDGETVTNKCTREKCIDKIINKNIWEGQTSAGGVLYDLSKILHGAFVSKSEPKIEEKPGRLFVFAWADNNIYFI